jgi:hypothetical protein
MAGTAPGVSAGEGSGFGGIGEGAGVGVGPGGGAEYAGDENANTAIAANTTAAEQVNRTRNLPLQYVIIRDARRFCDVRLLDTFDLSNSVLR